MDPRNVLPDHPKAGHRERPACTTLRHSAAVAWLEAGVHIKAVADLLGHSSIAITGDIYGHRVGRDDEGPDTVPTA